MKNILVLIDIQKEYVTRGRPFYLNGIEESLNNCKEILAMARHNEWEIVHVMHAKEGGRIFVPGSEYTQFVDAFEPKLSEIAITKSLYSCYSSEEFAKLMADNLNSQIHIIGYNSIMCCLSTIIEGFHKRQKISFVQDASLAKATDNFSEDDMHQHSVSLIQEAAYAEVIDKEELFMRHKYVATNEADRVGYVFKI